MEKIGRIVNEQKGTISINGHTDARPFRSDTYDNWRLSTARAHSAYYMLVRGGVDERRITEVAGFADREPKDCRRPDGGRQPPHRDPDGDRRMRRSAIIGRAIGLLLLSAVHVAGAFAEDGLQPYQLVRSLQLVQDRIAAGDHAALPMQAKLLEMTDTRLRAADADDFSDPKNFRALLVYGMSGGNPVTVEAAVSRAKTDPQSLAIAKGIIDYLNGRPGGRDRGAEADRPDDAARRSRCFPGAGQRLTARHRGTGRRAGAARRRPPAQPRHAGRGSSAAPLGRHRRRARRWRALRACLDPICRGLPLFALCQPVRRRLRLRRHHAAHGDQPGQARRHHRDDGSRTREGDLSAHRPPRRDRRPRRSLRLCLGQGRTGPRRHPQSGRPARRNSIPACPR